MTREKLIHALLVFAIALWLLIISSVFVSLKKETQTENATTENAIEAASTQSSGCKCGCGSTDPNHNCATSECCTGK